MERDLFRGYFEDEAETQQTEKPTKDFDWVNASPFQRQQELDRIAKEEGQNTLVEATRQKREERGSIAGSESRRATEEAGKMRAEVNAESDYQQAITHINNLQAFIRENAGNPSEQDSIRADFMENVFNTDEFQKVYDSESKGSINAVLESVGIQVEADEEEAGAA